MANARRCPSCGVPVTPFAAGCAVCGALALVMLAVPSLRFGLLGLL